MSRRAITQWEVKHNIWGFWEAHLYIKYSIQNIPTDQKMEPSYQYNTGPRYSYYCPSMFTSPHQYISLLPRPHHPQWISPKEVKNEEEEIEGERGGVPGPIECLVLLYESPQPVYFQLCSPLHFGRMVTLQTPHIIWHHLSSYDII